jgi:hypothetical protein
VKPYALAHVCAFLETFETHDYKVWWMANKQLLGGLAVAFNLTSSRICINVVSGVSARSTPQSAKHSGVSQSFDITLAVVEAKVLVEAFDRTTLE